MCDIRELLVSYIYMILGLYGQLTVLIIRPLYKILHVQRDQCVIVTVF